MEGLIDLGAGIGMTAIVPGIALGVAAILQLWVKVLRVVPLLV